MTVNLLRGRADTAAVAREVRTRGVDVVRRWRTTFGALAAWAQRTTGPLITAGDFNASVDHPAMRQLLASGLR